MPILAADLVLFPLSVKNEFHGDYLDLYQHAALSIMSFCGDVWGNKTHFIYMSCQDDGHDVCLLQEAKVKRYQYT